jgi:hypothetical protein
MLPQLARLLRDEVALTGAARAVLIVTIRQTVLPASSRSSRHAELHQQITIDPKILRLPGFD